MKQNQHIHSTQVFGKMRLETINEQQISNNSPIVSIIPEYKGLNHGTIRNGIDNF